MPQIDLGSVVGPQGPQGVPGPAGADGVQGIPGPNQVTGATSTTFGTAAAPVVLTGNGSKVGSLAFDAANLSGSANAIPSSASVFAGLADKVKVEQYVLNHGQTLTITTPNASDYILLACCAGAAGQGLYYLAGYSNTNANQRIAATIVAANAITVTAPDTGHFTIQNTHNSYGVRVAVMFVVERPAGALTFVVS